MSFNLFYKLLAMCLDFARKELTNKLQYFWFPDIKTTF